MKKLLAASIIAASTFAFADGAMADSTVIYTLSGATFDDFTDNGNLAETVSGTWTVDYTTMEVTAMSLTATGGETINFDCSGLPDCENQGYGIGSVGSGGNTQFQLYAPATQGPDNWPFIIDYQANDPVSLLADDANGTTNLYDLEGGYSGLDSPGGLTASFVPVPEPATWTIMLAGFGAMGFMLRGRRRSLRPLDMALPIA